MDKLFNNKVCTVRMHQKETGQVSSWINRMSKNRDQSDIIKPLLFTSNIQLKEQKVYVLVQKIHGEARKDSYTVVQFTPAVVKLYTVQWEALTLALTAEDILWEYSRLHWQQGMINSTILQGDLRLTFSQKVLFTHLCMCCMSSDAFREVGIWFQTPHPNRPWCLKTAGDNSPVQSFYYMKEFF